MEELWNRGRRGREQRRNLLEFTMFFEIFALLLPQHQDLLHFLAVSLYAVHLACRPAHPSLRVDLNSFSSNECKDLFRFSRDDIPRVISALRMPDIMRCSNGTVFHSVEGFMMLTYSMAFPNRLVESKQIFFRSEDDISRIFNEVLSWLHQNWMHLLEGKNVCFTQQTIQRYRNAVSARTQINPCSVFGFIDGGTLRPCARPIRFQHSIYNGMDRVHGLKYLITQMPDGMIPILSGPHGGAMHDSRCFQESHMERFLEHRIGGHLQVFLYGDQGFALGKWILTAYRGNHLTPMQAEWNRRFNACRVSVEWGIGKVSTLWCGNNLKEQQRVFLRRIGKMYRVSVLLTNVHTTLYHSETGHFFGCEPPSIHEYLSRNYLQ